MRYKVLTKVNLSQKFDGVEDIFRTLHISETATQVAMQYLNGEGVAYDEIITGHSHTTVISFYANLDQSHVDLLTFLGYEVIEIDPMDGKIVSEY
jgi:hypothetical protein